MPKDEVSEGDVEAMLKRIQDEQAKEAAQRKKELEPVRFNDSVDEEASDEDNEELESWKETPGTALPEAVIQKVRQMKREGFKYSQIKEELGVSENTISKYTSDIPAQRGRRTSPARPKPRIQSQSTDPVGYSTKRMHHEITKEVAMEALTKFQQILEVGKPAIDQWTTAAEMRGLDLMDYLELAVNFFEAYDPYIDKLERENRSLKFLLKYLAQRALPRLQRDEDIQLYMAACMVADKEPDPKDVLQLIRAY